MDSSLHLARRIDARFLADLRRGPPVPFPHLPRAMGPRFRSGVRGDVSAKAAADRLFLLQAEDWFGELAGQGSARILDVRYAPVSRLFEPVVPAGGVPQDNSARDGVQRDLERVLEIALEVTDPQSTVYTLGKMLKGLFAPLEAALLFQAEDPSRVTVRLPSLTIIESVLRVFYGPNAFLFSYSLRKSSARRSNLLYTRGIAPLRFYRGEVTTADGRRQHPFDALFDDLLHFAIVSSFVPLWIQRAASLFERRCQTVLTPRAVAKAGIAPSDLEGFERDSLRGLNFFFMWEQLTPPKVLANSVFAVLSCLAGDGTTASPARRRLVLRLIRGYGGDLRKLAEGLCPPDQQTALRSYLSLFPTIEEGVERSGDPAGFLAGIGENYRATLPPDKPDQPDLGD